MELSSVLRDVRSDEQAFYRERVIQYVDSVFTEVGSGWPRLAVRWWKAPRSLTRANRWQDLDRGFSIYPNGEICNVRYIATNAEQLAVRGCVRGGGKLLRRRHANPHAQPDVCEICDQATGG